MSMLSPVPITDSLVRGFEPYVSVARAAECLDIAPKTLLEAAARREVQRLGLSRRSGDGPSIVKELVDHWLQRECSTEGAG